MTPREAADVIAEYVWQWSKDAGSPMVLTQEDREEIAGIIALAVAAGAVREIAYLGERLR